MRKTEKAAFAEFVFDEAVKYTRSITAPEIETYFENLTRPSLEEVKAAWIEHKRGDRGHYFPKIVDLQRILRTAGDGAKSRDDHQCTWRAGDIRCRYPVGYFDQGKRTGFCLFHRGVPAGPDAQEICDQSLDVTPEKYLELLRTRAATSNASPVVEAIRALMIAGPKRVGHFAAVLLPPRSTGPEADAADAHIAAADAEHFALINALAQEASQESAHADTGAP